MPLDFERSRSLQHTEVNHTSVLQFSSHIEKNLQEEISFEAIYGPFDSKPFLMHVSPLDLGPLLEGSIYITLL